MIAGALLLSLAVTDSAFAGYRVAAGYDGRIRKGDYYRAAVARGVVYGLGWVALALVAAFALAATAPDSQAIWTAYLAAAEPMVWVFGTYATLVFSAFVPYLFGGIELRNLASVSLFGPITIARRGVVAGGAVIGLLQVSGEPRAVAAVAIGVAIGCLVDWALERWRDARPLP